MYKWIFLALVFIGAVLYFAGALAFDTSGDSVDISIDKQKAQNLGESIKDNLE